MPPVNKINIVYQKKKKTSIGKSWILPHHTCSLQSFYYESGILGEKHKGELEANASHPNKEF